MRDNDVHLSDQELLHYADGEISQGAAARVCGHLAACWSCRARSMELEGAIADFLQIHRSRVDAHIEVSTRATREDRLRSSLKSQMAMSIASAKTSRIRYLPTAFWQQVACAAIAVSIVATVVWRMHAGALAWTNPTAIVAEALPDHSLTPGYTRPAKRSELCRMRQPNAPPDEDVSLVQRVFREYGLSASTSGSYEVDYLITPDLGGADDVRNLWPEPYGSTEWNAHVKDELEDRLHTMVCDGRIDLATAQKEIATNWIAAYKRYFHTETPLPDSRSGVVSRSAPDGTRQRHLGIVLSAGRLGLAPVW